MHGNLAGCAWHMHDWTVVSHTHTHTLRKAWPLSRGSVGDRKEKAPVLLTIV